MTALRCSKQVSIIALYCSNYIKKVFVVHLHSTWTGEYTGKWCHNNDLKFLKTFYARFIKKSGLQLTFRMNFVNFKVSSGFCCSWFWSGILFFVNFVKNIFNFSYIFWLITIFILILTIQVQCTKRGKMPVFLWV